VDRVMGEDPTHWTFPIENQDCGNTRIPNNHASNVNKASHVVSTRELFCYKNQRGTKTSVHNFQCFVFLPIYAINHLYILCKLSKV
jgi:hypothetical protein